MTLAEFWELIKTGIPLLGIPGLFIYQHYKVKGLKDQINSQDEILDKATKLMAMMDLEKLQHISEEELKLLREKKDFEIAKIQDEMREKIDKSKSTYSSMLDDLLSVAIDALVLNPPERRREIVSKMKDQELKQLFEEKVIPDFEEADAKMAKMKPVGGLSSHLTQRPKPALTDTQIEEIKEMRKAHQKTNKKED
jgi:hypothetical protein